MKFNIDQDLYQEIAHEISSEQSPVGIDAKKTHVIILQKLIAIEQRLSNIESALNSDK
ncbi:MAG: hypothetical protein HKN76_21470 [Saprospiraceae bacterium]|nr:hypothetical protein [Saprospiraceae bacterium]